MASNLKIVSGGDFVGNPVIFEVTPGKYIKDFSFLRMKVKVSTDLVKNFDLTTDNSNVKSVFEISTPAQPGIPVRVDISSALRAGADSFVYERKMTHYPCLKYEVETWEEYMKNGEFVSISPVPLPGGPRTALLGAFSDKEMWLGDTDLSAKGFSRKPHTGEIVAQDEILMFPLSYTGNSQETKAYTFENQTGKVDIGSHQVYVVPPSSDRYHFYFLNGLGIIETISARTLCEETKEYKSQTYLLNREDSFPNFSHAIVRKNSSKIFKMSSGPLNEEWLSWWTDEFLLTSLAWIRLDGHYFPCSILPADSTIVRKYASRDVMEVTFSVRVEGL